MAMDSNRIEGGMNNAGGRIEDAVGGLTGDAKLQAQGKYRQARGQAQQSYGQMMDDVRDYATTNPIGAMLAAAGVGMILGMFLVRR